MRSSLRVTALTLALLLLAAGATVLIALTTAPGLRFAAGVAQDLGGGAISIGAVEGRLLDEFELRDFVYRAGDGTEVRFARARLRWRPRELLADRIHAERLDVDRLQVLPPPPLQPPSGRSPQLPTRLPLDIVIDASRIDGFELREAQHTMVRLDRAELVGQWSGDHLIIARLATAFGWSGALTAQGRATMARDHIDIDALKIDGPGTMQASGRYGVGSVASDLQLRWQDLRWPLIGAAPAEAERISGNAQLRGTLHDYHVVLATDAVAHELPITLNLDGSGDLQALRIEKLLLQTRARADAKAAPGTAQVQGRVAWSPALEADLDLEVIALDPALFVSGWNGSINGRARTRTQVTDGHPEVAFDLQIGKSRLRGYDLSATARGHADPRHVQFDALRLQAAQGSVTAQGRVAWAPALDADLQIGVTQLNPGVFAPGWDGRVNGSASLKTAITGGTPVTAFVASIDRSKLRDYSLSLQTRGELRGLGQICAPAAAKPSPECGLSVTLQQLELRSGTTKLEAAGRATPPFDLRGQVDSPDLAALYPGLAGQMAFGFTVQGPADDPHVVSRGNSSNLHYQTTRISTLRWDADVDPRLPSKFEMRIADATLGSGFALQVPELKLTMNGIEVYHRADIEAVTDRGSLSATLQGGYDRKRQEWGGQLAALRLAPEKLSPWSLEKAVGILIGSKRFSVEPACLTAEGGHACVNFMRDVLQPGLQVAWNLEALPLAGFKPLLPPRIDVSGRLDGKGTLQWLNGDIAAASAELKLGESRIAAGGTPALDLLPSSLRLEQLRQHLHATLDLRAAQGNVAADLTAEPASRFIERALSGQLSVKIPDVAVMQPFLRELVSVGGRIDGTLHFAGSIGQPRLDGTLALADGHARLVTPGIELRNVALSLRGRGDGPLAIDGSAQSGGGTLKLSGSFDPSVVPIHIDARLGGERFLAIAKPDARIWITPDLHLLRDQEGVTLDGSLTVPKADITPQGFGLDKGVAPSRDQVLVTAEPQQEEEQPPLRIYSNLRVALGDEVNFKGFGLTTRLGGAVTVIEEPRHDTRGLGELQLIDGRYKAYGQDLTIDRGRLIFDGGPITQPGVDLSAYRRPQPDIRVGVRVRGTLDKPQLSLDSDPAMAREQQLSWLLFGRPLDQNSTADRSMVSSAAMSLGLTGGDLLVQRIGKGIGLDQVSVGAAPAGGSEVAADPTRIAGSQAAQGVGVASAASQTAQLTLGKYLTPKLFVSYGVSLFQPGQTFRMLYELGHGFKVQTETGVASGGDLIYTIDRGH